MHSSYSAALATANLHLSDKTLSLYVMPMKKPFFGNSSISDVQNFNFAENLTDMVRLVLTRGVSLGMWWLVSEALLSV